MRFFYYVKEYLNVRCKDFTKVYGVRARSHFLLFFFFFVGSIR